MSLRIIGPINGESHERKEGRMKKSAVLLTLILALSAISVPRSSGTDLAQDPGGEAVIWYLGHCGCAVRTQNYFLVFDYQELRDGQQSKSRPVQPALDTGWINPAEIKNRKVRVFVSHSHQDHFDPVIFTWKEAVSDIAYYFGWKASDNSAYNYLIGPRAELKSAGLEIATINSHHSGVPEVAWLVKVDGLVIYHNGDCRPDDPSSEHDFLKAKTDVIDLAFVFPVYEEGQKYTIQTRGFFNKFRVRAAFPMHAQAGDAMYFGFQKAFQDNFPGLTIHVPMRMGHKFVFENGKIAEQLPRNLSYDNIKKEQPK
jgi:L-ascorbate metabolism protein UlaG (beta-lactamase superfamily)